MKKLLKNWKFSIIVLVLIVIFNIVFLCQPVFGTYKGVIKYEQYGTVCNMELKFNDGFASISEKLNYSTGMYAGTHVYHYNIGTYERYGDKIFCIVHRVNDPGDSHIYLNEYKYVRNSVFSLSSEGGSRYTSIGAIFLQIGFSIAEILFLVRFIFQVKSRNKIKKETEE